LNLTIYPAPFFLPETELNSATGEEIKYLVNHELLSQKKPAFKSIPSDPKLQVTFTIDEPLFIIVS